MPKRFRPVAAHAAGIVALSIAAIAGSAAAQDAPAPDPSEINSAQSLRLPEAPQVFGSPIPSVVKATAIVNGDVITMTDVNQRLALLAIAQGSEIPANEVDPLREQILRNLIDESLQVQAAKRAKIEVKESEINRAIKRVADRMKMTMPQFEQYLTSRGSSIATMRRQVEGEIAWSQLQRAKIESGISVGDDEVNALMERMNAAKGTQEYRVGEIFLSATPANQAQAMENANRILEQLRNGAPFMSYARQYSEASTAAVGGDLGWVRPEQLPSEIGDVLRQMTPGAVSNPIAVPGGVSIITVQDTRRILTADPRDAVLSLKQITVAFPSGTTKAQAEPVVERLAAAAQNIGGCGGAERIAGEFKAEVVQSDEVKMRDLPPTLQQLMIPMQVGQATPPFGTLEDGVRILVLCGRDEKSASEPSFDQLYTQIADERINMRARRYLRDLRRDAVIEFR